MRDGSQGLALGMAQGQSHREEGCGSSGVQDPHHVCSCGYRHLRDARGSFISKAFKTDHEARSKQITNNLKGDTVSVYVSVDLTLILKK